MFSWRFFFPDVEGKHIGGGRAWRGGFEELITECSSSSSCIGRGLNSVPTCRWIWPFASTSCGSCCKGSPSHHSGTQSDKQLLTIAKTSFSSPTFMKCCVFVTELGLVIFSSLILLWTSESSLAPSSPSENHNISQSLLNKSEPFVEGYVFW